MILEVLLVVVDSYLAFNLSTIR